MLQTLEAFTNRVWPGIEHLPVERRRMAAFDILGVFYAAPLALAGVVWLALVSDWSMLLREWLLCVVLLLLLVPLSRFTFFVMTELRPGMTSDVASSLDGVVAWTAALLLGPVGLWLGVVPVVARSLDMLNRDLFPSARWSMARNELVSLAENTLSRLAALEVYLAIGGRLPFPGFTSQAVLVALIATLVLFIVQQVLTIPLYVFLTNTVIRNFPGVSSTRYLLFLVRSTLLLTAGMPFAILAAGMYVEFNLWMFLYFFGGLVMVSYLSNQLSRAMMRGQQQARLLEGLESLGRGLLLELPNEEALLAKVREHISTGKLPLPGRLEIRLFPQRVLVHEPQHWEEMRAEAWDWLQANPGTHFFKPGEEMPWGEGNPGRCTAFVVIEDQDNHQPIGGIFHAVSTRGYIDPEMYRMFIPVLESLADQVALAVRRAQIATQMLAHQRVDEELRLAGDIQGSFLPARFPDIAGWKLSAILTSARDTSGDYFDFINLPDGRVAIIEADVADKGVGAALYMALSRAYLRSQAISNDPSPAQALSALNRRILQDTTSDLFVTVFYGLIAPGGRQLVYANAGHPPPIVVRGDPSLASLTLPRTGMAVGVLEETGWEEVSVDLESGDFVVIYSDGMTDSMNPQGELYGAARIKTEAEALRGYPPLEVRKRLMDAFQAFASSGQEDDVTLLVLGKD